MTTRLVILDRDGVINHDSPDYIKTVAEWLPIEGSIEAITLLQQQGFTVAIATNQSGIGRGYYSLQTLHDMHTKMNALIESAGGQAIQHIAYCPHVPSDNCDCRKPKAGLLDQLASDLDVASLEGMPFVGDSLRDLHAAEARNMQPILVKTGKGQSTLDTLGDDTNYPCFENLAEFAVYFISRHVE